MPVSTASYRAETVLETAVLCNQHGISYFKSIESTLQDLKGGSQDQLHKQRCSVELMRKLITTVKEQLQCQGFWQVEIMVMVIKHIASSSQDGESDGLSVLLDNGLIEILSFVFDETSRHVTQTGREAHHEADHLIEVLFETINDVAEYSGAARKLAVEAFCARLIKLVIDTRILFHPRMEAERTLNLLLEGCEDCDLSWVGKDPVIGRLMQHLAELLPVAGDFEMQIAVTESLARMVTKSERKRRSPSWFPSGLVCDAFLAIEDQQFDSDCRTFLNLLNENCQERSVFSFPCEKAFLGDCELRNPSEDKLSEFWVDFNAISQSITMYVADEGSASEEDGGLWETVTFSKDKVKEYIVKDDAKGYVHLVMTLTEPPSSILAFCGSKKQTATIMFQPRTDLTDALAISIGLERNCISDEAPSSARRSSVSKINVLVNRARNTSWGLSNMPQSFNDGYVDGGGSNEVQYDKVARRSEGVHSSGAKATPVRRKMSIPLVPMTTPSRTSLHSTPYSAASSADKAPRSKPTNQGFAQPRTPVGLHGSTKKVKTPLQVTVADKANSSGAAGDVEHPKPHSSMTPAKVSVTRSSIVCPSPVVRRESEGKVLRPMSDDQEGVSDASQQHQQGNASKKTRKGRSDASDGKQGRHLDDAKNAKLAPNSAKGKKSSGDKAGKASGDDTNPNQPERIGAEESSEAVAGAAHPKKLSQDITAIPDTQESRSLISQETETSEQTSQPRGRKRSRKAAADPPREGSRKSMRCSKARQVNSEESAIKLPQMMPCESKSNPGKKFKLYSDTSLLMESPASDAKNAGSKTNKCVKNSRRGNDAASDTASESEEYPATASKEKATTSKRGRKKIQEDNKKSSQRHGNKRGRRGEKASKKPEASRKEGSKNTELSMVEDILSQDFVVPKMTAKGKYTLGVNNRQGDQMTSGIMMYNPDPQEEENLSLCLPHIDESAAAKALAAENAEYCVPSSAPEERCDALQDKGEVIPDSQPQSKSFRRSGRFPSPLLSDITEESTISKGSSGPKNELKTCHPGKQLHSPHTSSKLDDAPELLVIKSTSKPETAKADSTSVSQEERDPYDFVDSSTVSSLQVVSRKKNHMRDGSGYDVGAETAPKQCKKTTGREKAKESMAAYSDTGMEVDSQDEFASHSHTFGQTSKGSGKSRSRDQGKRRHSGKGPKKPPEVDEREATEPDEDDLVTQKNPHQSSRRKMKGKLDSDDTYIQRIQREAQEKAAFVSRMQAEEEDFPNIEVARDIPRMTEAYDDTDISTFVKSVMKSLPKYQKDKHVLKNPDHREEKIATRRAEMKVNKKEDDEEAKHTEEKHSKARGERARKNTPEARNRASKSLPTDDTVQENEPLLKQITKTVAADGTAAMKEVRKGIEDKPAKKTSRKSSGKLVRGDESLTEGELSVDELVSAHMNSILGSRRPDSIKKSASKRASEDGVKERRRISSCKDRFEVDEDILKRAEDTILRRSKVIAAMEHSSMDLSDTEQDEGNDTAKADKTPREQLVEKGVYEEAEDTRKRVSLSSITSIHKKQPHVSASDKLLSSESLKNRRKCKQDKLNRSDDEAMYNYDLDMDDLQSSGKEGWRERSEHNDSISKKSKLRTPKTCGDDISSHGSTKRSSTKKPAEQEDGPSDIDKPTAMAVVFGKSYHSALKNGKTHFGSQIEDTESEESMETASTTPPDDTSTVISVESFSSMCKDLLKSSGKGIAAGRGRRKLQKVDYTEVDSSCTESDDGSSLKTPGRSVKKASSEKLAGDIYEYREETSSCCTASIIQDSVSERSWLADRPKQKVSTYSKLKKEVFGLTKITKNLDSVKKPRCKPQVKDANAPRKKKSHIAEEEDEEVCRLYYSVDDKQEVKKAKKRTKKGTQQKKEEEIDAHREPLAKKPKNSCRRSLVECMSSISCLYDSSQGAIDEDDVDEMSEGTAEEEQTKDSIPATPAMTIETVSSQLSAWTTPGSGTRTPRTPKQVSFVDELESLDSDKEGHIELEFPFSGPSKNVRPSESALKRKYGHLASDVDDEKGALDGNGENTDEENGEDEEKQTTSTEKQHGLNLRIRHTSFLEPKILFRDPEPVDEPVLSEHSGEDGISDHSVSSSWGQSMDFQTMQMPEMFGFMTNRLKRKMMEKKNQTQQFTETAIQSTQKQMNKLFLELHKARQRGQTDFQQKLLTELVGMESSLEKLSKIQSQYEYILKQLARKSTQHVEQHLSKVEELHTTFLENDARLGENVVESLQQVISKDMKNMLKKMLQDMQQEQMKKTMQSLFLMR